uniref:GNAT family N-acetyltransferase n=1 Tax=Pedobacter schmidteae TaxID=2201271 RepID=UPI000EB5AC7E|nr:GNAT family N-acetyltransferase [Pedobacter schmidteae]
MIYRPASKVDGNAITALNNKFYQAFLEDDKQKGFLKNKFTLDEIETLIASGEVVVAEFQGEVIGYYLTNSIFESEAIRKRKLHVQELIEVGTIRNVRYVYHTQAVVDRPYMGKGVGKALLKNLKKLISSKFDYLIGYIDQENLNARLAHTKSGWEVFTTVEGGCLAMTKVSGD